MDAGSEQSPDEVNFDKTLLENMGTELQKKRIDVMLSNGSNKNIVSNICITVRFLYGRIKPFNAFGK